MAHALGSRDIQTIDILTRKALRFQGHLVDHTLGKFQKPFIFPQQRQQASSTLKHGWNLEFQNGFEISPQEVLS